MMSHGVDDDESVTDSDLLMPLGSETGTPTEHSGNNDPQGDQKVFVVESLDQRTAILAFFVMLMWFGASGTFLYVGITSAQEEEDNRFEKRARDLAWDIEATMKDYEVAALWIHEACRNRDMTFEQFRDLYDYLSSNAVFDFPAAAFVPNVTHEERAFIEKDTREYLEQGFPGFDYQGFSALGQDGIAPVGERDFYLPIQFSEPLPDRLSALSLDAITIPEVSAALEGAIANWEPTISAPFPSNTYASANSVTLFHPGVPLPDEPDAKPRDLGGVWVVIPSLILSASQSHLSGVGVYLFDSTFAYLGAAKLSGDVTFLEGEFVYDEMLANNDRKIQVVIVVGTRKWTVVVVPVDGSYDPDLTFVLFGGGMIFLGSLFLALWLYHNYRRGQKVQEMMNKAKAENAIVASLFPTNVRDRLLEEAEEQQQEKKKKNKKKTQKEGANNAFLSSYGERMLAGEGAATSTSIFGSKPIADLFPNSTIMFADLVGFTAWSSVREPAQVFTLLETIYHSFDMIAKKRRVFKVETVGDCYVAVAGLPQPRKDHAVVMARFATDCLHEMHQLVRALETSLGPDTGDLDLRVGLHSGEVTAGVLRGDKGRFQLFGDTMNTASRMESTGFRGRIQVSGATAELLEQAKKSSWVTPREDLVVAKGKGELQTYWLDLNGDGRTVASSEVSSEGATPATNPATPAFPMGFSKRSLNPKEDEKIKRLVKWNVEVLATILKKVVGRRKVLEKAHKAIEIRRSSGAIMPLDEVQDIITLPEFEPNALKKQDEQKSTLSKAVTTQLEDYVSVIASMYHRNPFHNFEHASHVTMSVTKLLSRIIEPSQLMRIEDNGRDMEHDLHDYTFGITSDPLTHFACAFSALIHDVDHPGVPNSALIKEDTFLAQVFREKSVAEQNSVEIAWQLLMGDEYKDLRECIFCDQEEFEHFRQLVVNVVLATDVMDKDLGAQRKARWEKAFSNDSANTASSPLEDKNRKATIVIEHIIQASDVSHTMQHWHIYAKWNERLFHEMYRAFKAGRLASDPSTAWYEGEKGFFDFYIIPLAKKLDTCGVFGASSYEYYNYAVRNRQEWEVKGQEMVEKYLQNYEPSVDESQGNRKMVAEAVKGRSNVEQYLKRTQQGDAVTFRARDTSGGSTFEGDDWM